jgi:hypothetical protein
MRTLIIALMLAFEMTPPVTVKLSSRVVMKGAAVRVTCTVPRDATNRGLTAAVVPYQSSYRQLDGDAARVTYEFLFEHIPCDAEMAICSLESQGREPIRDSLTIQIAGCEQ